MMVLTKRDGSQVFASPDSISRVEATPSVGASSVVHFTDGWRCECMEKPSDLAQRRHRMMKQIFRMVEEDR